METFTNTELTTMRALLIVLEENADASFEQLSERGMDVITDAMRRSRMQFGAELEDADETEEALIRSAAGLMAIGASCWLDKRIKLAELQTV